MVESFDFIKLVLDSLPEHIVVIDKNGDVLFVNKSWVNFGKNNSCLIGENWSSVNYLDECDKASAIGDLSASKAAEGIRGIISNGRETFYYEYPCHSSDEKRWFMMRITSFTLKDRTCLVISHHNITERILAEEKVLNLSRLDGLTGIPNRRYFDEFLEEEWKRCRRLNKPISLALIDIDHFKILNDTYGHQAGDECLKQFGGVLKQLTKRPAEICARYGGEEFALVYGDSSLEQATVLIEKVLVAIRSLNIPNKNSPTHPTLTASFGLASMFPGEGDSVSDLISVSDRLLYQAKKQGGNQIKVPESQLESNTST